MLKGLKWSENIPLKNIFSAGNEKLYEQQVLYFPVVDMSFTSTSTYIRPRLNSFWVSAASWINNQEKNTFRNTKTINWKKHLF